jgi:hypothetical protein
MRSRNSLLAGVLGVGLLVSGSAIASRRAEPSVSLTKATVTANWKESFMKGSVSLSGTTTGPVNIEASVRSVASSKLVAAPLTFFATSTFAKKIKLGARPVPGSYRLQLADPTTGNKLTDKIVKIPAPREGVVDTVSFSRTTNGPRVKVFRGTTSKIVVRFHFVARPKARSVTFTWKKPGNPKVRFTGTVTKPYKQTVTSFVCAKYVGHQCGGGTLRTGKWYAILKAAGRVVKRQDVTVT